MKKLVVLSGAGISAESGIKTFRDADGLWEGHDVMQVATPQAWTANPQLVLDFYNQRRAQLHQVSPNDAHHCIAGLESDLEVHIITQNVDDLHERAGSSRVLHLHGELFKVRSSSNYDDQQQWYDDLQLGDLCNAGSQLRPHIVWFGEDVPAMDQAINLVKQADILMVVGTSLQVYPAAGLIDYVSNQCPIYLVDPNPVVTHSNRIKVIAQPATTGVPQVAHLILDHNL